jgi:hypothetical protein
MSRSGDAESGHAQSDNAGLSKQALRIAATVRSLAGDLIELLALETRLIGVSLAAMFVLCIAAATLLVAGWLLLQLGVAWWLREAGVAMGHSLLALGAANVVIGWCCWLLVRRRSRHLTFANTRAALARLLEHEPADERDLGTRAAHRCAPRRPARSGVALERRPG